MVASWLRRLARALSGRTQAGNTYTRKRRSALQVELLEDRVTPSTLIPVTNHRDLVFDANRDLLYITTSAGAIQQYSIPAQTLLSPLNVGTSLNGADISPDGSALYVAENQAGATQGVIHKVNLATDAVTDLPYNLGFYEGGSWDVALGQGGKGLASTSFNGSGWTPLRQLDLGADTLSIRTDDPGSGGGGEVFGKTMIHRSADRSTFLVTESGISSGPLFLYNATTDTFSSSINTNTYLDFQTAINRNGSLIAYEKYGTGAVILDHNFNTVTTLAGSDGGVVFDPNQDILYGVNTSTSQIVAYDTNTWSVKFQLAIGETVSTGANLGNGTMTVSNDGSLLFLATPSGVRMFSLPSTTIASSFAVSGLPSSITAGAAGSFTVSALNSAGSTAVGYTGTVHISSSDPGAQLPGDYTFTAADHGVHTFNVTLTTAGVQSLTAVDQANTAITGTQTGITVNAAAATQLVASGPGASSAGAAFSVTVQARDAFGNQAAGYSGTVHFSSSDGQATLPANYTFAVGDAGAHTFTITLKTAGNESLTVADTISQSLTSTLGSIAISPAAASRLSVGGFPSPITAGVAGNFTVSALDAYGNVATGYSGTLRFSTGSQATLPANYTFTSGDQGVHTFGATLRTAGSFGLLSVDVANANITGTQSGIVVNAAAVSGLRIYSTSPNSYPANVGRPTDVTVMGADAYGNAVPGYTGTVHFTSSDGAASLPADYTFTAADNGLHTFANAVTMQTAGSQTITATDTSNGAFTSTMSLSVVNPMSGFHLGLSTSVTSTVAGTPISFTVTALDGNNNTITGYYGTVYFSCSTGHAYLPYSYTFTYYDNGVHTFTNGATLYGSGNQVITAIDPAQSPVGGGTNASVTVAPAAASFLSISGLSATTTAGNASTFAVVAYDYYGNVAAGYTGTVHFSSSDVQAVLPANAALSGGYAYFSATLKTAATQSLTVRDTVNSGLTITQSGIVVNPAAASNLVVSGFPTAVSAGVSGNFTVTAKDAFGNVATSDNGTIHFTSSDAQAVLPSNTTLSNGTRSFSAAFKTAGNQTLTATDTLIPGLTGSETGIGVAPAAASALSLTGFPSNVTAGVAGTFTVTVRDAFGNVASGYTGAVRFSSTDARAGLPANYTFTTADAGVHTFSATLKTAGMQSLSASDTVTTGLNVTQAGIQVAAAAPSWFNLTGLPVSTTAGSLVSFTVIAQDLYGNIAVSYAGAVAFTGSDSQAVLPASYTFTASDQGVHTFTAAFKTAGTQNIVVKDTQGAVAASQMPIQVNAAAATNLSLGLFPAQIQAGSAGSFTVVAGDAYGNIATGYAGTVTFSSSDAQAGLPASYTFTAGDQGRHTFSATLRTAGIQSISVRDTQGGFTATQAGINVTAAAASKFTVAGYVSTTSAGQANTFTVIAKDAFGNTAVGYSGTVVFSSSDIQAGLPAAYTFASGDQGSHTFSATLKTAGTQSLSATDSSNSGIAGTQAGITVVAALPTHFVLTAPASIKPGVAFNVIVTAEDAYGNIAPSYRGKVHFTSSDRKAGLPADYTFTSSDNGVHTFSATLKTLGTQTLTVKDNANSSITGSASVRVSTTG